MRKVVLHIGGPKCGSSTLQRFFGANFTSYRGVGCESGGRLHYAAIGRDGKIRHGEELRRLQARSPLGYVASAPFPDDPDVIYDRLLKLNKEFGRKDAVILSNEGWANAVTPRMAEAFDRLGVPVEVFFVARPPVDWMNASWWQWGCWTNATLDRWINSQFGAVNFYEQFQKWASFDAVDRVVAVDLSQDILRSAVEFLGVDQEALPEVASVNVGTNFHLLRHLVNNKEKYGRTVHAPSVEFHLNGSLDLPRLPPPFVVPVADAREIIARTKEDNEKLIDVFSLAGRGLSEAVCRKYLDERAYDDVEVVDVERALAHAENDEFIGALVEKVLQLTSYR